MTQDNNEIPPAGRSPRKEVELFPVVAERNRMPAAMVPTRQMQQDRIGAQISLFNPVTFEEAVNIVDCLRTRASATICLDNMRKADAERLIDFVSGASAAIDGDFHKLNDQVYFFSPSNMRIIAPGKETALAGPANSNPLDFLFPEGSGQDRGRFSGFNS